MRIQFLAKRRYTNKDTLRERFGRCYQLPWHWAKSGHTVRLDLVDYRGMQSASVQDGPLTVRSWPVMKAAWQLAAEAEKWKPDAVVASGDCFIGLLGLRLARATEARFVFDVYDDYRTFGGYRLFLRWDAYAYLLHRADVVSYASRAVARQHVGKAGTVLLENGVDSGLFRPIAQEQARRALGIPSRDGPVVGYFGSIEAARGVSVLIDAIEILRASRQNAALLICGRLHDDPGLGRPWIDYRGMVEHASVPDFINACDVVALPYLRTPFMDAAASCKIAEYLMCRRPIAATRTPNLTENFPAEAAILADRLAEPGDAADLARVIALQLDDATIPESPAGRDWPSIATAALAAIEH